MPCENTLNRNCLYLLKNPFLFLGDLAEMCSYAAISTRIIDRDKLPADTIVCNGAGNFSGWVHRYWRYAGYPSQLAPTAGAANDRPQALAWNIGTTGRITEPLCDAMAAGSPGNSSNKRL